MLWLLSVPVKTEVINDVKSKVNTAECQAVSASENAFSSASRDTLSCMSITVKNAATELATNTHRVQTDVKVTTNRK